MELTRCYPKAPVQGGDHYQKKVQEPRGGEIEVERECEPGAPPTAVRERPATSMDSGRLGCRHHVNLRSSLRRVGQVGNLLADWQSVQASHARLSLSRGINRRRRQQPPP